MKFMHVPIMLLPHAGLTFKIDGEQQRSAGQRAGNTMDRKSCEAKQDRPPKHVLKSKLRLEVRRAREALIVNKDIQASLTSKTAEAERWRVTILAYNSELHLLGEMVKEMSILLEVPFAQCTVEKYEDIQRLQKDLHDRLALGTGTMIKLSGPSPLTRREKRIYGLIDQGLTSKEIAVKLSISDHTIKTHRKNIRRKLKA